MFRMSLQAKPHDCRLSTKAVKYHFLIMKFPSIKRKNISLTILIFFFIEVINYLEVEHLDVGLIYKGAVQNVHL